MHMRQALLLSLAVFLVGCGRKEPLHQGKPASYWIEALQDSDAQVRRKAAGALADLKAPDAVPQLITALKDRDGGVRSRAAEALWSIGPEAGTAVPDLTLALKDQSADVRMNAAGA